MPEGDEARFKGLVKRTEEILRRADTEIADLSEAQRRFTRILRDASYAASNIAKTGDAARNLAELSRMAIRLEGAYVKHSDALNESADGTVGLEVINILLGIAYFGVAAGKVMDVIATVTGQGKWITSAKSAIIDVADSVQSGNKTLGASQVANLGLIAAKETELFKAAETLQTILSSIIDLIKDVSSLWSAPKDLSKAKFEFGRFASALAGKVAKAVDAASKLAKLYDAYLKYKGLFPKAQLNAAGEKIYVMRLADYLAAAKYAIEALANFCDGARAVKEAFDLHCERANLRYRAGQNLAERGGWFNVDLVIGANLNQAARVELIHMIDTAPEAREIAQAAGMRARELNGELARMRGVLAQRDTIQTEVNGKINRVNGTDRDLQALRRELEGVRGIDRLKVAVCLDLIDAERRQISRAAAR